MDRPPPFKILKTNNEEDKTRYSSANGASDEELDLRQVLLNLQKAIQKNTHLREKYAEEPSKFLESELDLHAELKKLQDFTSTPELYGYFLQSGGLSILFSLLQHENKDILIDVVDILKEISELDALQENEDSLPLMEKLLKEDILQKLVSILNHMSNEDVDEANCMHACLEIVENLTELLPEETAKLASKTKLIDWLLNTISNSSSSSSSAVTTDRITDLNAAEDDGSMTPLKLYSSEILSILLTDSLECRNLFDIVINMDKSSSSNGGTNNNNNNGISSGISSGIGSNSSSSNNRLKLLMSSLGIYAMMSSNQQLAAEELEFLENIFDSLCSLMATSNSIKDLFRNLGGFEMLCIFLKTKMARKPACRLLNFSLSDNPENIKYFIKNNNGIRILFPVFMLKNTEEYIEHIVAVLLMILRLEEQRCLCKFQENQGEKFNRLLELYIDVRMKVRAFDKKVQEDRYLEKIYGDVGEDLIYLERLNAGLLLWQQLALIISSMCQVDILKDKLLLKLSQKDERKEILDIIDQYLKDVEEDSNIKQSRLWFDSLKNVFKEMDN